PAPVLTGVASDTAAPAPADSVITLPLPELPFGEITEAETARKLRELGKPNCEDTHIVVICKISCREYSSRWPSVEGSRFYCWNFTLPQADHMQQPPPSQALGQGEGQGENRRQRSPLVLGLGAAVIASAVTLLVMQNQNSSTA